MPVLLASGMPSKFEDLGPTKVRQRRNLRDYDYNEIRLSPENIQVLSERLGGEIRRAWLYGEWVDVAITFTQHYHLRQGPEHNTKTVFLGEYLEENFNSGWIHVQRESLQIQDANRGL